MDELQKTKVERDTAQALIGDIRAIVSRPGKRLDAIIAKLIEYEGDYELRARRRRDLR